ncbi:hypothetical protein QFC22_004029 [Naganishia vaughanmartiniae]|uniref:Uncharacterized protein n=1 Tax=Naganishia vaughanmartiniae TaxID=1424756 RepID=A0ACC2X5V2_9TREE|nr:hypothetical protein QFC22_004029 [Naganishia vaughanmartiniae]
MIDKRYKRDTGGTIDRDNPELVLQIRLHALHDMKHTKLYFWTTRVLQGGMSVQTHAQQHGQQPAPFSGAFNGTNIPQSAVMQSAKPSSVASMGQTTGNSFTSSFASNAKKPGYTTEEPPKTSRRDRSDKVPVRQLVSRLMWAHGDASQPSSDTVDTMMDIVHEYIFDIVSGIPFAQPPALAFVDPSFPPQMTPPQLIKPSPPNYAPQSQRFQAITPSILHRRLQAPHHRKKLASLKEVVSRQKVEKQKKKTSTVKVAKASAAPGLGGLGMGFDDMDFLNM